MPESFTIWIEVTGCKKVWPEHDINIFGNDLEKLADRLYFALSE